MTTPYIEMVRYWTRVEGEEDRVRTFARIPDGYYGETDELPEDDQVYYWLEAEEWEESLIGKVFGDALVLRTEEIYEGECDSCGSTYDLSSRWNRCGDCGDCGKCCQHSKEWEAIGVYQDDRLICVPCSNGEGDKADAEALPDGFTCDECGKIVNV